MSLYIGDAKAKTKLGSSARKARFYKVNREECLTFSARDGVSISVSEPGWDGTMEYRTPTKPWVSWDGSEITDTTIYIRGINNTKVTGDAKCKWCLIGTDVTCSGNIETLLDYVTATAGGHPTMAKYCYAYMFDSCTSLTKAPELPATTLTSCCYAYMFDSCTSLTKAPELPATTLTSCCYEYMFSSCDSLTKAPELPATTLAGSCYQGMFFSCDSLTQVPELPATTLTSCCYRDMFSWCINIQVNTYQTDTYTVAYRIPKEGTGSVDTDSLTDMFKYTGGKFYGTPEINTTYYLHSSNTVV